MPRARLNDESAESDAQFAFLMVVCVDQSLLIVNTINTTHNATQNTLQLSNSEHFPDISWKKNLF